MTDRGPAPPEALPGLRAAVRAGRRGSREPRSTEPTAQVLPVARVLVDTPLAHLDRAFDYSVPESMDGTAQPGVRVKVRFAGKDLDGFVVERAAGSGHPGTLAPLRRVVSPEPVLHPAIADLCATLAERYAGTRADLLRLAVPPRHAATEREPSPGETPLAGHTASGAAVRAWEAYPAAPAFLAHLSSGGGPRAVWVALPGADWPLLLAHAAGACLAGGRGSVLVVPDRRDVDRLDAALTDLLGAGHHAVLTAGAGPARRYREFLAVSRGTRRIVVGTRAAAFAPVADLGLVAIWDDGDDLHAEPRAPYPHAREVLLSRAHLQGAAALVGGFARSVEGEHLVASGWAHEVAAPRPAIRQAVHVSAAGATETDRSAETHASRMPREVYDAIAAGVGSGPVLVQTPRRGYAPTLACERCRTPARCPACTGPLAVPQRAAPLACRWCGAETPAWACPECAHRGLRAPVVGERRTAEELGRAFPGVPVVASGGDRVVASVPPRPAVVVATPGAEPVAADGYAAVVLLDAWLALSRPDLRTEEEALRRWLNAAGLVRHGGAVVVAGDAAHPAVQALVRWDPAGFARRESEARAEAHLPPASRLATVTGDPGAVDDALTLLERPPAAEVLGPVPIEGDKVRLVIRVPRAEGAALSRALGEVQRVRSARKLEPVRIQVDPVSL